MSLAAVKLGKLRDGESGGGVCYRADGKGDKHLIGVQTGIVVAEVVYFELLLENKI